MSEVQALVLDIGSHTTKAGFGGDSAPRAVFPTVVGRPRHRAVMVGMGHKDSYVGDEAQAKRGVLRLSRPVEHSFISNFDDYEKILHHAFYYELRVAPEEHPCLFVEPPLTSKTNREKVFQIQIETFSNPATGLANSGALALFSTNRVNGVVVEVGDGCTHVSPVLDGRAVPHAIERLDVAGGDLTDYLTQLVAARCPYVTTAERESMDDLKQKHCFVAQDFEQESSSSSRQTYELPDSQTITVDTERCRVGEALFRPRLMGEWAPATGVHEVTVRAVSACDLEKRNLLLSNVVVAGGGTMLPGFGARLRKELTSLSSGNDVKVIAPVFGHRKLSAWIGGSMIAQLPSFGRYWMSKEYYDENGPAVAQATNSVI